MTDKLSHLLSTVDILAICGEYKLWLHQNYIVSLWQFHLSVDTITREAITKLAPSYLMGLLTPMLHYIIDIPVFAALVYHRP